MAAANTELLVKMATLEATVHELTRKIERLEEDNEFFKKTANRWIGGFTTVIVLSSVIGFLLERFGTIKKIFTGTE